MNYLIVSIVALAAGFVLRGWLHKPAVTEDPGAIYDRCEAECEKQKAELTLKHWSEHNAAETKHLQEILDLHQQSEGEKAEYRKTAFLISPEIQALIDGAATLASVHDAADMSGEAKRHQVYARMIKDNPDASRNDIALAIEFAVRKL